MKQLYVCTPLVCSVLDMPYVFNGSNDLIAHIKRGTELKRTQIASRHSSFGYQIRATTDIIYRRHYKVKNVSFLRKLKT